jgi:hypothetical protein
MSKDKLDQQAKAIERAEFSRQVAAAERGGNLPTRCPDHPDGAVPWWSAELGYHMKCKAGGIIEPDDVGWECEWVGAEIPKEFHRDYWDGL